MVATIQPNTAPVPPDLIIRQARIDDLRQMEWDGAYINFRRVFADTYRAMQRGQRMILIAEKQAVLAGQVFIQFSSQDPLFADGMLRGYLYSFRVKPEYQRQGIGTALLHAAEDILRDRGYHHGIIAVAKDNPRAQRLYEREGYRVFSEDPGEWQYYDHLSILRQVIEPCWVLEKLL